MTSVITRKEIDRRFELGRGQIAGDYVLGLRTAGVWACDTEPGGVGSRQELGRLGRLLVSLFNHLPLSQPPRVPAPLWPYRWEPADAVAMDEQRCGVG